ncbi:hypothetical protein PQX77_014915 [Marasmius sp. AFHP31]|nr:hypothetical protein PQX77_014915 [Marasmius sp. AFHP31]
MSPTSTTYQLFPTPSPSSFTLPVDPDPGRDGLVRDLVQENQIKHHVFYNKRKYHNHIPNHILAVWAMGGDQKAILAAYENDSSFQIPAIRSPHLITDDNWVEHLGDERAYLEYFKSVLQHEDIGPVLEQYVFSEKEMLSRFVGGVFHPMILVGHGCEFLMPGLLAEGLAQTAVHPSIAAAIIPPPRSLVANTTSSSTPVHALSVLARIVEDNNIRGGDHRIGLLGFNMYQWVIEHAGDTIAMHVDEWADFDAADQDVVVRKTEELSWLATVLYAVPGFQAQEDSSPKFKADLFTMHLITSALFLPSLFSFMSPASKRTLLRAYLITGLVWWVSRGKPRLDITGFFSINVEDLPFCIDLGVTTIRSEHDAQTLWTKIIEHSIDHPDDHLVKCQRALYHFSMLYRSSEPFPGMKRIDGFEKLDGSLFIRAATLTAQRLAGSRKGNSGDWDL